MQNILCTHDYCNVRLEKTHLYIPKILEGSIILVDIWIQAIESDQYINT